MMTKHNDSLNELAEAYKYPSLESDICANEEEKRAHNRAVDGFVAFLRTHKPAPLPDVVECLKEAIRECIEHNSEYQHITTENKIDKWQAAIAAMNMGDGLAAEGRDSEPDTLRSNPCQASPAPVEPSEIPVIWEWFYDSAYFHMYCVRKKGETEFNKGFHIANQDEAKGLCDLLNKSTEPVSVSLEKCMKAVGELQSMAASPLVGVDWTPRTIAKAVLDAAGVKYE